MEFDDWEERIAIHAHKLGILVLILFGLSGCGISVGNRPPIAIIEATPERGSAPLTVQFDGSLSSDPNNRILIYEWDFGDGAFGSGPLTSHTYNVDGVYLVTLLVVDETGARDEDRTRIVIGNPPPQALFTTSLKTGWAPLDVVFDGTPSFDPSGSRISMYEWDFGDGFRTTGQEVNHTYTMAGKYEVELTITDLSGNTNLTTKAINVIDMKSGRDLRSGRAPTAIMADDLDGDGVIDLVVPNSQSNDINIYFGQSGSLLFPNSIRIPVGERPVAIDAGDLNGDGLTDLAVASFESGVVSILMNEDDRHFREVEGISVGQWISDVLVEDFNRDGILDIAATDSGQDRVFVLLGDGTGEFTAEAEIAVDRGPEALLAGDFDSDGRFDLAVLHFFAGTVEILTGNGLGQFRVTSSTRVGEGPTSIESGHFDADSRLDLIVSNSKSSTISILSGSGNGTFTETSTIAVGRGVRSAAMADFDADGSMDLATANASADTVSMMLNDGFNQFIPEMIRDFAEGKTPTALVVEDFNDDGFPDVAIVHFDENRVTILVNQL